MRDTKYQLLSKAILHEYKAKPSFNKPTELLAALEKAKAETGKYPVYSGSRTAGKFVKFVTGKQLAEFKAFRKPRWKRHGKGKDFRIFHQEIADTYAGGLFPDHTPYEVDAMWRKGGMYGGNDKPVLYIVSLFIDGGWHIDTQRIKADRPIALDKVLAEAAAKSLAERGTHQDGSHRY